jgi:hypothetical protein
MLDYTRLLFTIICLNYNWLQMCSKTATEMPEKNHNESLTAGLFQVVRKRHAQHTIISDDCNNGSEANSTSCDSGN